MNPFKLFYMPVLHDFDIGDAVEYKGRPYSDSELLGRTGRFTINSFIVFIMQYSFITGDFAFIFFNNT